jgi:Fe-S oxidoreductase/FAD/FMN-containing dehydrogenase
MIEEVKEKLKNIFGERVAFHQIERMLYSNDLGTLPELVKNQIVTNPDAVVQPNNNDEIKELLNIGTKYHIPLIPRGSGTAGYGGAVPTKGGIVADFYRMKKLIDINKEKRTITVEPGIVWNDLEAELQTHDFSLRLYPGSAISATVGGWIANGGGVGIGSFEYGFNDNIHEVEIVTPKGTRRLTGDDLDFVYGMGGTTGFISQVTLRVRNSEDDIAVLGAFYNLEDLFGAFKEISEKKLPLWDVTFRDPKHVQLSHQAVKKEGERFSIHREVKEPSLPQGKFIVMFVYPKSREDDVKDKLLSIVKTYSGEVLDDELARFEWDERFYPMRLKALGPSIIPCEVIIPAEKLPILYKKITIKIKKFSFTGSLINKGKEVLLLTYVLDDERRPGFPLAYSISFEFLNAARKLGGRPYTIGMFFTDYAELLFGKDNLLKIYNFKKEVDPDHIMNPGKIFPPSLEGNSSTKKLNLMIKLARRNTWVIRAADKFFGGKPLGEVIGQKTVLEKFPFSKEAVWDAFACASCGYCRSECPEFNAIGWESASPRGKFNFIKQYLSEKALFDERMAEMFFVCTTCGRCKLSCQLGIPINEHGTLTFRPTILQEGFHPPIVFQRQAHNILMNHNPKGSPQNQRKAWMTSDIKYREEGQVGYFAGCSASFNYILRNLPINAFRILNKAGIEPVYLGFDEWCCGGPMFNVGCIEEVLEKVIHNIKEINRRGIKTLLVSCPGCWAHFTHFYPILSKRLNLEFNVKIKHITEIISELIEEGKIKCEFPIRLKVTYSDPCHIGRGDGIFEPPRKILRSISGLELIEMPRNREHAACCGRHVMRYPRLGIAIISDRVIEAKQTGASAVVSCCPTCESNFRMGFEETGTKLEVLDITDLVAKSMGLPILTVSKLAKLLHKER